jgi:NodT family efflux transporter outer membrane factor (OMF) lipoprotein
VLATTLGVAACSAFGPQRNPPTMPTPTHYGLGTSSADGANDRRAIDSQWWTAYQSPVLDEMVDEGLAHSPSLAAARATLKAAREGLRAQVGNNVFPSIDLTASPARQRALGIPILPQETFLENIFAAQLQASYTFDFFGAAVLADRALAGQVRQQAFEFEATRRALAANIVAATINAASLQEQLEATEQLVSLGEMRAAQIAARFAHGSASRVDALAAEQDAANAAATLPGLRAQALAVRHAQAILLGRTPDQAPEPLALGSLQLPQPVPLTVPSDLLHQRPDILAAEAAVRAAADEAGAATASMFPSLTLSAAYGRGGFDWSTFSSPAGAIWSVGATITQPLFHGGALRARKRQYEATYDAAVAQYRQTVLSAFRTVADTLVSLQEDQNTLAQADRAARAAQAQTRDTESRYKLGATPFYATLSAGQQYQNSRVQVTRARAAQLADAATLLDSLGDPVARQQADSADRSGR